MDLYRKGETEKVISLIETKDTFENNIDALNLYATILLKIS